MPILGLREHAEIPIVVDCGDQMRARPIAPFIDALSTVGLSIRSLKEEDKFPLEISGRLHGGKVCVSGQTSQYLSALLIALPLANNDSEITVSHLQERPYLEMTLGWLDRQKIVYSHEQKNNDDIFSIPGNQCYQGFTTHIPGDFSSAANIIVAAVVTNSKVTIENINLDDTQGDKILISFLQQMNANIKFVGNSLIISGNQKLNGMTIDLKNYPDLLPILAVLGTQVKNGLHIKNASHARQKETDRIHSMCEGLTKLGAKIVEYEDGLTIYPSELVGSKVNGYDDHRTVMALAVAGIIAKGRTVISDGSAINKTFPQFIKVMQSLGASMEIEHATV